MIYFLASRGRRAAAVILAAVAALLLGLAGSSAALACPVTLAISIETAPPAPDDCDHSALGGCVAACSTMCQAVSPATAGAAAEEITKAAPFRRATETIKTYRSGPDPPPPRIG